MAAVDTDVTTSGTTLNKVWRKEQGNLLQGFRSKTPEYALVKSITNYKLSVSAREITAPININRQGGTAMIAEGGYEAQAGTRSVEEVTLTWVNANQRFTVTLTTKQLDHRNRGAQIIRQMKYQTLKAVEGMSRRVGETFYGFSTGVVCLTSTNATQASGTYTLIDAYGQTQLDTAAYLAGFFAVGDRVVLVRAGALVANAFGTITAVDESAGTIAVTWAASVDSDANDQIVFANNIENTTLDAGTDWNKWPIGLMDATKSTSVHGLSGSTVPGWTAGYTDTAGGRFTGVKLRKARYGIANKGGGKADRLVWSQGVETDVYDNMVAARQFNDAADFTMEGVTKTKEKQFTSPKVPPGHVFMWDSSAFQKFVLEDLPSDESAEVPMWEDGDKIQGRNAWAFAMNIGYAFVVTNRGNMAIFSSVTEQ